MRFVLMLVFSVLAVLPVQAKGGKVGKEIIVGTCGPKCGIPTLAPAKP